MALNSYRSKRNFKSTPEPDGSAAADARPKKADPGLRFVVQLHEASRRHYDLRLELDGTMKSWAVPKGPSLDPMERRLAVEVEDHPMEYNNFEGVIPPGNYGAGIVMIWDEGSYQPRAVEFPAKDSADALRRGYAKGHLTFVLEGQKLRGEFALIRLARSEGKNWLLVKKHDAFAHREDVTHADRSARSQRTLGEIAAHAQQEGRIWSRQSQANPKKTKKKSAKATRPKGSRLTAALRKKAKASPMPAVEHVQPWKTVLQLSDFPEQCLHPLLDGYRALLLIDGEGQVRLQAKTGMPLSRRFPRLVEALQSLPVPVLLDGLIIPLDDKGEARRRGRAKQKILDHAFFIYDLLHAEGYDLQGLSLKERLQALASLELEGEALRLVPALDPASPQIPEAAIGILQRSWTEPYPGSFSPRSCRRLGERRASPGERPEPAFQPGTRHEVSHRTARPQAKPQVALTNLSKLYWPREKIAKAQLLDYYKTVAGVMVPHLRDRPQSLHRHPHGIDGPSFFQKEVAGAVPSWMETATIGSGRSGKTVTYALCQSEADLLFLANMGCIEINTWLSRVTAINSPDFVVFDLDPGQIPFTAVIEVARAIKKLLDAIEMPAYCKSSGSRGLHIYVPVHGAESFDEGRIFAHQLSQEVHRLLPATTSLERSPARRTKLIYLDYLQNRIGQTMAAVYSVRPKPHATVSTPLRWSELKADFDPGRFTISSLPQRLDKLGDLWQDIGSAAVFLPDCQKALDALTERAKRTAKKRP